MANLIIRAKRKYERILERRRGYKNLKRAISQNKPIIGRGPLNVQIQTTSVCNGKCKFCPYQGSWFDKNPGEMSWKVYDKIIQNLKKYKIGVFYPYFANEPLFDKGLFKKIRYAVENLDPDWVELSTSLSILNEEHIEEIKNLFPKIPHRIVVSFHGISRESYADIMGLIFERALENVLTLIEISQHTPLNIFIHGTNTPRRSQSNLKIWFGEDEYLTFWNKKLSRFKVKPKISYFSYNNRAGMPQLRSKGRFFNTTFRKNLRGFHCQMFDRWAYFLYTGEMVLCCMDYNKETVFGDIENSTIEEIFSSPNFLKLIKKAIGLIDSEEDFICKRCDSPFLDKVSSYGEIKCKSCI